MKFAVKEGLKTYAYLYLMTAPFTYLVTEAGKIGLNDGTFIFLNIFIAVSLWVYLNKIQPLLNAENRSNKTNIFLFLLIATVTLFSIRAVSLSSEIKSDMASMESDLSILRDEVSSIKNDLESLVYR